MTVATLDFVSKRAKKIRQDKLMKSYVDDVEVPE